MQETTFRPQVQTDNITHYMKQIQQYKRITEQREVELADLIHNGSPREKEAAREELICANLRLVVKIAHDFKQYALPFQDIIAEGNCGLMLAADKFEPSKGARFSCYAAWWIKQSIRKALLNQTRTIRIPGGAAQKISKLQRTRKAILRETGKEPTEEELSAATGISMTTIENLRYSDIQSFSMDDTVEDDEKTTYGALLHEEKADDNKYRDDMLDEMRSAMQQLSE